jgi:hypothetical protein
MSREQLTVAAVAALTILSARATPADALINLEWRPATQTVLVGETVEIGLYAVSDDGSEQTTTAMDVILDWNPDALELVGVINNGPYPWLFSGFTDDSTLDGLNDTFLDGDALYSAFGQLGDPAVVTAEGLLVTTFEYVALAESPATTITIPEERGFFTRSRIFDGDVPGLEVQGSFGSTTITIVGELPGDCNGNGQVDLDDYVDFEACLLGPDGGLEPDCECFDFNDSDSVDLHDFAAFQTFFTG